MYGTCRDTRVYCVIPTHNRIQAVRSVVAQLEAQSYPLIVIVFVDDGSCDGTTDFLMSKRSERLELLHGDGTLWWGGAMEMGMRYVVERARDQDYLLMLNDDVEIGVDFVEKMVVASRRYGSAVIGATQRAEQTGRIMSRGYNINYLHMRIAKASEAGDVVTPDALPGRGAIIPLQWIRKVGVVDGRRFPHYLSDIEYFARLKSGGATLVVLRSISICTSETSSDVSARQGGVLIRYLSSRSKDCIWPRLRFFSRHGPLWLRLTCVPRFVALLCTRFARNIIGK